MSWQEKVEEQSFLPGQVVGAGVVQTGQVTTGCETGIWNNVKLVINTGNKPKKMYTLVKTNRK